MIAPPYRTGDFVRLLASFWEGMVARVTNPTAVPSGFGTNTIEVQIRPGERCLYFAPEELAPATAEDYVYDCAMEELKR